MELYRALPEKIEPNRINDNIGFESFAEFSSHEKGSTAFCFKG